jgi:hypothetical protein
LRPGLAGSQDDIYPPSATEIHNRVARSKARETNRIAATAGEIERELRQRGELVPPVKRLTDRKAQTGLSLTGSAGLLVTTLFGEPAIAALDRLFDIPGLHFSSLSFGSTGISQ